jgi:Mrp family chromosome partitioning ATPase
MPRIIHYDEASKAIVRIASTLLDRPWIARIAVLDDLSGNFHLLLWLRAREDDALLDSEWSDIEARVKTECGGFWSGRRFVTSEAAPSPDHDLCQRAWEIGERLPNTGDHLRYVDRHRSRTSWFMPLRPPSPGAGTAQPRPAPVVAFYSYKGGMGRTTAAAGYAIQQARSGRRVAAVDLDLDAPGLGRLLSMERDGASNPWGTVDFLVEYRHEYELKEYRHVCNRSELVGEQPVDVFPVGRIDEAYLRKLAKIDLDIREDEPLQEHPVGLLLARIRADLQPDLIVVDCRAGLSPISGFMLSPLADVHVVFSTASDQALDGLTRVVHRLGADRLQAGLPQAECVLVQAMLPGSATGGEEARRRFDPRVEDIFRDHYYYRQSIGADITATDEAIWTLDDINLPVAPHRALAIPYTERMADFRDLADILEVLAEAPYRTLAERIGARLDALDGSDEPEDV